MKKLRRETFSGFWTVNLAAWTAYALVSFVGALPYIGLSPHLSSVPSVLVNRVVFSWMGLLNTGLVRCFYQHQRKRDLPFFKIAACAVPLCGLAALTTVVVSNWAQHVASKQATAAAFFGGTISAFAAYLCWYACYFAFHTHREMLIEQKNALQAKVLAHESQLMAIRGQLHPHFLFNSLNSIQALIEESPARAQQAVVQLASLLRHSLTQGAASAVPLSEETEVIRKYLAIEKIRFEENLLVQMEIEPGVAQWPIPTFLLQPLIENAVRYGMQTSSMPLEVSIRASGIRDGLSLEVSNTGRWVSGDRDRCLVDGSGLGLRLVRDHLEQSYPGRYRFTCGADKGRVVQRIEILSLA